MRLPGGVEFPESGELMGEETLSPVPPSVAVAAPVAVAPVVAAVAVAVVVVAVVVVVVVVVVINRLLIVLKMN